MSLLYYNAEILVYRNNEKGTISEYGIYTPGKKKYIATIKAHVYPISIDKILNDYGISTNISYEVLVDPSELIYKGTIVQYQGNMYEVKAVLDQSNSPLPCIRFLIGKHEN